MEVVLLFALIVGLMLIGVPIAFSLGLSSIAFLLLHSGTSLSSCCRRSGRAPNTMPKDSKRHVAML